MYRAGSFINDLYIAFWLPYWPRPVYIGIGNSIISSAITDKQARVSF